MIISLLAICGAIVVHESVHALAALTVGCTLQRVCWFPYPAVIFTHPHHRGKVAWIALAAPGANLLLFVICGFQQWGIVAAAQLVVAVLALLPYPKSDSWQAWKQTACNGETR